MLSSTCELLEKEEAASELEKALVVLLLKWLGRIRAGRKAKGRINRSTDKTKLTMSTRIKEINFMLRRGRIRRRKDASRRCEGEVRSTSIEVRVDIREVDDWGGKTELTELGLHGSDVCGNDQSAMSRDLLT